MNYVINHCDRSLFTNLLHLGDEGRAELQEDGGEVEEEAVRGGVGAIRIHPNSREVLLC